MKSFKEGDHVVYFPTGAETNPTSGVIKKIIHESEQVGTSEEIPRYVNKQKRMIICMYLWCVGDC